jgi:hypothetical protein
MAFPEEKRELVIFFTSSILIEGKKLELKPSIRFREIANRPKNNCCDPQQDRPRTFAEILTDLVALNTAGQLPDLDALMGFQKKDSREEISLQT